MAVEGCVSLVVVLGLSVHVQIVLLCRPVLAPIARVGLLSRVGQLVAPELVLLPETLPAFVALVLFHVLEGKKEVTYIQIDLINFFD